MKIRKADLVAIVRQVIKEESFSGLSLQDEIKHLTQEIDMAVDKNDFPMLLKMYKALGGPVEKAAKEMRIGQ